MTYTFSEDLKPHPIVTTDEPAFTPVYARKSSSRNKPVKTWMILAPIGLLVLGGGAAALLMNPADETAPLAEPAPTLSVPAATPATPVEPAPLVIENAVAEPAPTPARTVRQPAPAARRAAPPAAPRVETPPQQPAGPQPYTGSLNTGASVPAPTPAPPVIVIQPQG